MLTPAAQEAEFKLPELKLNSKGSSRFKLILASAAAAAALLTGVIFVAMPDRPRTDVPTTLLSSSAAPGDPNAWFADFAPDPKRLRKVSILRSSMERSDYQIDFDTNIEIGAAGWVFRARDSQNYWVARIEERRTAVGPSTTLVRYPVVNGMPLSPVRKAVMANRAPGEPYKVRTEVLGNHFTIWIQGQKMDVWTDNRLMTGGAGLYTESGERATIVGQFSAVALAPQK